jgi:hypothetical protein
MKYCTTFVKQLHKQINKQSYIKNESKGKNQKKIKK